MWFLIPHARLDTLSPAALRGLKLFVGRGNCHLCHSGPSFTDGEFHNNRVPMRADLPLDPGRARGFHLVRSDPFNGLGRFSDGRDEDVLSKLTRSLPPKEPVGEVKTPTLRNVARTAPYMHQGQLATLADVVDFYSDEMPFPALHEEGEVVLVPLELTPDEKAGLVAFLESLSDGGVPEELLRPPELTPGDR